MAAGCGGKKKQNTFVLQRAASILCVTDNCLYSNTDQEASVH